MTIEMVPANLIDILVPTRGRAPRVETLLTSIQDTCSDVKKVNVYFYVDYDDEAMLGQIEVIEKKFNNMNLAFNVGPRQTHGAYVNFLWSISSSPLIMMGGDDIRFLSKDWDRGIEQLFSQYPDNVLLVYGPDGFANERLAVHPIIHRDCTKLFKWFVPPYFKGDYADTWVFDVYRSVGRALYVPQFELSHDHVCRDGSLMDATYAERRSEDVVEQARALWDLTYPERMKHSQLLKGKIQ